MTGGSTRGLGKVIGLSSPEPEKVTGFKAPIETVMCWVYVENERQLMEIFAPAGSVIWAGFELIVA